MAKLMIKELENIFYSIEPAVNDKKQELRTKFLESEKKYWDFMYEVDPKTGKQKREIINFIEQEVKYLDEELKKVGYSDVEKKRKLDARYEQLAPILKEHEELKKEMGCLQESDKELEIKQAQREVVASKLQETYDAIEEELKKSNDRLDALASQLSFERNNKELVKDISKEQIKVEKLERHLKVFGNLQKYDGTSRGLEINNKILDGLDIKSAEYELACAYIEMINKYGNVKKDKSFGGNSTTPPTPTPTPNPNPVPPQPPEDDDKKKDDDIIDINDYDLHIEETPQMPKNISQKPEKTWKTVAAVALGIGAAAGVFATFGVAGAGVVFVASGIARKFIKKKEKTIKEEEQKLQEYAQKIEDYNNQSEDIRKTITQFVEKYNTTDDEEMKKAIKAKIDEFRGNLARNNEFVAGEKAKMEEIIKRIYPDLKADEYNGPQKITSIEDAKEKIKAKGRKFKAYLGSKEGLRDARWFMNSAQITSGVLMATSAINGFLNGNSGLTPDATVAEPTVTDPAVVDPVVQTPEPSLYDGISVGGDVSGYNLSVGHDTASWALDGTNAESLISEYVNSTNSIFKGFRIQSGNGTIPLDLKGMNLTEFLNANPGIDPSTIVADVASKDGISQAWVSIDELVSGLGGKTL